MKITKTLCVDLDQKLGDYLSVFLHLSQANKTITLYAKGYAREGVDARGIYIEMRHVSDYSAGGIPIRLFLVLLLSFSWRFEEFMALGKDQQLIHVVRDKVIQ